MRMVRSTTWVTSKTNIGTGGVSKDACYEVERGNIPLMLLDIDSLVKAIFRITKKWILTHATCFC